MKNKSDIVQRIAAKAVITNNAGKLLILREASTYEEGNHTGRYQFPGGRIDPGEPFVEGLHREVMEETGLKVKIISPLFVGEWWPTIKGNKNQIVAIFIRCEAITEDVKVSEEHDDYKWIDPTEYKKYDLVDPEPEVIKTYLNL